MVTSRDLASYRQGVEEAVVALGRNDVGVLVEDGRDGTLAVTFSLAHIRTPYGFR